MFMRQPVVFGILVVKVLLAFFCITKLVLKINTRAVLPTIDGPREKTTFQRLPGISPAAQAHRSSAAGQRAKCLRCQHKLNGAVLPMSRVSPNGPFSLC